ncbi:MAG: trehalose-6-phosphate synthase [Firmicutes bacterium]|nr:trehalose-6-phosphate synthase [Bacillota bacterium]
MQSSIRERGSPGLTKLLKNRPIIIASNRGPVEFRQDNSGDIEMKRGGGGLVTAMTAVSEAAHAVWISAAMNDVERSIAQDNSLIGFPEDSPQYRVKLVNIPKDVYNSYYNTISNPLLWFIHHYIWNLTETPSFTAETHQAWKNGYVVANKLFAEAVAKESLKHDSPIIMLQDYHLFIAAKYIREITDEPFLFHFTHIPWPEPDYMSILPFDIRQQLLKGMLANDMVGFQSRHYAGNFLLCCESLLGAQVNWRKRTVVWQGREVYVRTYPISIDHANLHKMSESSKVLKLEQKLLEENEGMNLIVRTDRSDPSKNIVRGFMAYDVLLTKHPELKEKVKFLALLYPTRENIREYKRYRSEIEATVEAINKRHKTKKWTPIYLRLKDNYPESIAALKCYDVLLVNPIFDGMNLVAKEGPAINTRNGVLVLSQNAGASSELGSSSIIVNPFDIEETANAMYQALTMSDSEKQIRAKSLKEVVEQNNSIKWLHYQLKDIVSLEKKRVSVRVSGDVPEKLNNYITT